MDSYASPTYDSSSIASTLSSGSDGETLYIGNLPFDVSEQEIRQLFERFGTVNSVSLVIDRVTGRSRGFAFVDMASVNEARSALTQLDNSDFHSRNIRVNFAKEKGSGTSRTSSRSGAMYGSYNQRNDSPFRSRGRSSHNGRGRGSGYGYSDSGYSSKEESNDSYGGYRGGGYRSGGRGRGRSQRSSRGTSRGGRRSSSDYGSVYDSSSSDYSNYSSGGYGGEYSNRY